jgi:predicted glycosyltransferase
VSAKGATVLLSPRSTEQGRSYQAIEGVRVLEHAVSGLDLLWASDLVMGAGGTMTREAAILGTPSYTLFSGKPAAVDGALIDSGRLVRVSDEAGVEGIRVAPKPRAGWTPPEHRVADVVTLLEKTFS